MRVRSKDGLIAAERHFREAVARDPEFGAAWAALAETVILLHEIHRVRGEEQAYAIASDAARRALTTPASAADGHAALSHILWHQCSWTAAEEEAKLAVAGSPGTPTGHAWLGYAMMAKGRLPDAERAYRRAVDLDPLGPHHFALAICLIAAGRPEEAIPFAERGIQTGSSIATLPGVIANVRLKRFAAALKVLDNAPAGTSANFIDGLRAYLLAASGRKEPARQLLSALVRRIPQGSEPGPLVVPYAYAALEEPDLAIGWVSGSSQACEFLAEFRFMPEIAALATKPKMRELLRKAGLSGELR